MIKLQHVCCLLLVSTSLVSCFKRRAEEDDNPTKSNMIADIGFRPQKNGYPFQNEGGKYPLTPGIFTASGVVKMFGKDACVGGDVKSCKLTPAANEWMGIVNRHMNIGQCEGMAVSALTFFKKKDNPGDYTNGATSAHDLTHKAAQGLIGYYWAFQMLNPVRLAIVKS